MDQIRKLAEQLQDKEIQVLKELGKHKSISIDAVSGLKPVEASRASMYLENKKLITQIKVRTKIIELDMLGRKYAKTGLPEFKFLELVSKKPLSLDSLKQHLADDEVKFALGYWKKKGIVLFDKGLVRSIPVKKPKTSAENELVKKLAKGSLSINNLSKEELAAVEELGRRKAIIKISEKTDINLRLTNLGKKIIKDVGKLAKGRVGKLTKAVLRSGSWKKKGFRRYDVEAPVPKLSAGRPHPYIEFLADVKRELISMGFKEEHTSPIVEATFFNCDALFMPQDHPARGVHGVYSVKGKANLNRYASAVKKVKDAHETGGETGSTGWDYNFSEEETRKLVLRSHDTAVSPRTMLSKNLEIPGKYFTIARCYRPDVVDATHLTEFNQMGGFVLGEDLNFGQLLGLLAEFCKRITGVNEVKFVPGYFPFTEPSVECLVKLGGKWIEVVGAGVFRPELCRPLGINVPVLAWGFGIDRLFMIREGIKDIRYLFSDDLKWLRGAKL